MDKKPDSSPARPGPRAAAPDTTDPGGEPVGSMNDTHASDPPADEPGERPAPGMSTEVMADDGATGAAKAKPKVSRLGDFQLTKKLGQGGMGAVFKARQTSLERDVAVKILARHLADNQVFVERFQREARVMAKLDHPHILGCYSVGEAHGYHYLAMEYADGGSLDRWIKKFGKLKVGDALHIVIAAADALQHAHELGLIHRDIKPDNILLTSKGVVKLADLGLAKAMDEETTLTRTGTGAGTPVYMSPEQTRDAKHVDGRSDIYALGCMLYCCLTGKPPFTGETYIEIFEAKEKGRFTPASKLSEEAPVRLDMIIERMLNKEPKYRYQTCSDLIRDLEALEMANPVLSFMGTGSAQGSTARPLTVRSMPAIAAPAKPAETETEWWYVKCLNFDGTKKMTRQQVLELIKVPNFDLKAEASRSRDKDFRALASFREFEAPLRARMQKELADRKASKYKSKFQEIIQEEEAMQRSKKLNALLRKIGGWVILIAALAGLAGVAYYVYTKVKPAITKTE